LLSLLDEETVVKVKNNPFSLREKVRMRAYKTIVY
jgi:hypothetical protein